MFPKKYNFKEIEPAIQNFWEEKNVYVFNDKSEKPIYSIDTPPPTVNGKIHIGHLSSYSHIDIIARYKRMNGYEVFYPFGFDDNGLPTERLVEKNIGKRAHEIPREEFVRLCLEQTQELETRFKGLFKQMAQSPDWRYQYSTINNKSRKTAQKSFLDLYYKGRLYRGNKAAQWCTECRTSVAQQETETKDIETLFNYIHFKLDGLETECLDIATTRPELLPACCCVFVNPDDDRYKSFIGKNVIVPIFGFSVPIIGDDKAMIDKGTGAVMCCTFGDQTDYWWYQKYQLPHKIAIDECGMMTNISGQYSGMYSLDARKKIIEDLRSEGALYKQENLIHQVAVHERCGTPLEIVEKKQWFINLLDYKEEFLRMGDQIQWHPETMKKRYSDWVNNIAFDWCISRQRYFGVMFPVWYCSDCGATIVADENELPVDPTICLPKCDCPVCHGRNFVPENDIMDTWMTSSVSPLINLDWANDNFKKNMMPMSLRPNAHDIIRTWDFDTIVKQYHHFGEIPWKDVMISGFVMANKTEKLSKRKENAKMEPLYLLDTYSSDITRYWTTGSSGGNDVVFSEDEFLKGRKLVTKIFNAAKFTTSFLHDFVPNDDVRLEPMDAWVIAEFNRMFITYQKFMDKYMISPALKTVEHFFWNYCDNYIEIVKNRLYKPEIFGQEANLSAKWTCYYVLLGVLKCFAPVLPHITEYIYQEFFVNIEKEISIHLTQQRNIVINFDVDDMLVGGQEFVDLLSTIRTIKSEKNLSMNTPIESCTIKCIHDDFMRKAESDFKAVCQINKLNIQNDTVSAVDVSFE